METEPVSTPNPLQFRKFNFHQNLTPSLSLPPRLSKRQRNHSVGGSERGKTAQENKHGEDIFRIESDNIGIIKLPIRTSEGLDSPLYFKECTA